jgi:uncharacterized protein YgiM (DUF1202 family)
MTDRYFYDKNGKLKGMSSSKSPAQMFMKKAGLVLTVIFFIVLILSKYLKDESKDKQIPPLIHQNIESSQTTTTDQSTRQIQVVKMKVIAPQELNVRDGPGTEYKVIGKVYSGNILSVYKEQDGWAQVGNGWVRSQYLTKVN